MYVLAVYETTLNWKYDGFHVYVYTCIFLLITKCVAPFYVATSMSRIRHTSFFVPDPVSYARAAVATIGIKKFTHGYVSHAIQVYQLECCV